ncbi:MAG: glycosyltransferase family 4 protein [Desulfitobacteriaceae bacterium]
MNILALVSDAFGGYGGIALYNRHLLTALCSHSLSEKVIVLPRQGGSFTEQLPNKLVWHAPKFNKVRYAIETVRATLFLGKFDIIVCGHINLLPLAWMAHRLTGKPILLLIYGIDAWEPPKKYFVHNLLQEVRMVISISSVTVERFQSWANLPEQKIKLLPNAIQLEKYYPDKKPFNFLQRYDLLGRKILLTLSRLPGYERYKGHDQILNVMHHLLAEEPLLKYVIAGDGDDRPRLEKRVYELGLQDFVVFTGMVAEEEKVALYRAADVFAMPSKGEGFGFVFLEAMACGIPVVASKCDGSREAVLDGKLGTIVDPDDPDDLIQGIMSALNRPKRVPEGLDYFSYHSFEKRVHKLIDEIV